MVGVGGINQAPFLPQPLKQSGAHASPEDYIKDVNSKLVFVMARNSQPADAKMHLLNIFVSQGSLTGLVHRHHVSYQRTGRQGRKILLDLVNYLLMGDIACRGHHQIAGYVIIGDEFHYVLSLHLTDVVLGAEDRQP